MTLSDNAFSSAANQAFPSAVDPQSLLVLGKAPPCAAAAKQQLIPPPQPGNYLPFFQEWSQQLRTSLEQSLPAMPAVPKEAFVAACQSVQSAVTSKQSAEKVRDDIEKVKPVDEAALADAKQAVADAETAAQHALDACQAVAVDTILDDPASPVQHILTNDLFDDADLVTYTVLMHATPVLLAQWCDNDPAHAQQLLAALHDVPLLRLFLESGGARNGRYGRAVELYHQINILHQLPAPPSLCSSSSHNNNPVLQRLALAVALELADPYKLFDQAVEQIDAVQRYVHYEQAFLLGELDPAFGQFNVWELRQVVNSDATEGELSLGRQSLINYRPDFCLSTDALWRYCIIVRTDVLYTTPDWYKSRKSYDQILSGGGKVRTVECGNLFCSARTQASSTDRPRRMHFVVCLSTPPSFLLLLLDATVRTTGLVRSLRVQGLWYPHVGCPATRPRCHDPLDEERLGCLPRRWPVEELVGGPMRIGFPAGNAS